MRKGLITVSVLLLLSSLVKAEDLSGRFGLGLNYPGISIKYGLSSKFAIEARGQFGDNISVYGVRGYYYYPESRGKIAYFSGVEGDLVSFKGEVSKGKGYCVAAFLGGEYLFSKIFSFQMDFGPVYVSLRDDDTDETESEVDYLVNLGLNLYLGGKEKKR